MKIKRIKLEKPKNTREFGGYPTVDGRTVRHNMLIRSGQLSKATDKDIKVLTEKYKLKTVIDLRIDAEIEEKPDNLTDDINYVKIPLLDKAYLGITRDDYSLQSWFNLFADETRRPEDIFFDMYEMLVFGERSKALIPEIFSIFAGDNEAVLWHCSAGKDRVGIVSMLILLALGVKDDVIVEDFLATNRFSAGEIIKTRIFAPLVIKSRWQRKCLAILMGVKKEYMDRLLSRIKREYSDIFDFFEKVYSIDKETILNLREKYLQ